MNVEWTKGQRYLLRDSKGIYQTLIEASVVEISPSASFIKFQFDGGTRWEEIGKYEQVEKLYTPSLLKDVA